MIRKILFSDLKSAASGCMLIRPIQKKQGADTMQRAITVLKDGRCILVLSIYAKCGHHTASMKVVHMPDPVKDGVSETRFHSHRFYELAVILRGRGVHRIGKDSFPIRPGLVYLLQPGEYHKYEYTEQLTLLTFMFDPIFLRRFRKELKVLPGYPLLFGGNDGGRHPEYQLDFALLADLDLQSNFLAKYELDNTPGNDLLLTAGMLHVLVLILQAAGRDKRSSPVGDIGAAVSYMNRNYYREITLGELARMSNLSVSSFCRKFCREFQEPPIQWLLKLRLRNSIRYLVRSDMTIHEIAKAVGFSDPFYYSRQFRKFLGCTPSVYRERNHGLIHTVSEEDVSTEYSSPEF